VRLIRLRREHVALCEFILGGTQSPHPLRSTVRAVQTIAAMAAATRITKRRSGRVRYPAPPVPDEVGAGVGESVVAGGTDAGSAGSGE
jgi:cysteine sulfinate desulfinase/cysteine desulfurase-like protein